jgi:hypothetical protein
LTLSVEAHFSLQVPRQTSFRFTGSRATSVLEAFVAQGIARKRLSVKAWGNRRPLVWSFDEETGACNRRVELYLRHGEFEVPKRKPRSAYAVPPGAPPRNDDEESDDPDQNDQEQLMEARRGPGGERIVPPALFARVLHMLMRGENDEAVGEFESDGDPDSPRFAPQPPVNGQPREQFRYRRYR